MKRIVELMPAAAVLVAIAIILILHFLGNDGVVPWAEMVIRQVFFLFAVLVLGLCLFGPLIAVVRFIVAKIRATPD